MSKAIRIHEYGGPDAMRWETVAVGAPAAGEALVKHRAVGLNYIDIYHRTGVYPLPALPSGLGMEGAGDVVAVGPGVTDLAVGDRVAYASPPVGAYAEERVIAADRLVKIPAAISYETGAAMMLQGMTVSYLFHDTYKVGPGTVMLFHAAAGGVGLIACQWARRLGATLIGTAGSDEKAALAKAHGAAHVINYRRENFVERVREITGGALCDVVYDSVGHDTFPGSLDCLKPRGLWVSFGNASGKIKAFDIGILSAKGSLYATRPTLMTYTATRADLLANANRLIGEVAGGTLKIEIGRRYPLADAAAAHRDLEARATSGSVVMIP